MNRRLLAGGVVLLVVAVAVAGVVIVRADDDAGDGVGSLPGGGGSWAILPEAPIEPRLAHVMVATDDELILWGGYGAEDYADGAAYSFEEQSWRELAPSPLPPRLFTVGVWTGEEVLFWGGETSGDNDMSGDGAAYDPSTDTWRTLPDSGYVGRTGYTGSVWTGSELVLVGVVDLDDESTTGLTIAFDPATGVWRSLDPVPPPQRLYGARDAVWSGEEVLVTTRLSDGGDLLVDQLDPEAGSWATTITTETGPFASDVWAGTALGLIGTSNDGLLLDPATGERDVLPSSGGQGELVLPAVTVSDQIVVSGDHWLDLGSRSWRDLAPLPGQARYSPDAVAHDGRLYVWGGDWCPPNAMCTEFTGPTDGLVWTPPS